MLSYDKRPLKDRIIRARDQRLTSGPPRYLTDEEEKEPAVFLHYCAKVGYARTRLLVMALVQQTLKGKGLNVQVSNGWWESFKRRNPKLSLRTAEPLSYARLIAGNPDIWNYYYDLSESTLIENDLTDKPSQIFNTDETGLPLDPASLKVVVPSGYKHSQAVSTGDKPQVTVLAWCNAAGYTIPPLVIFDRETLKPEMTVGEVPGTMYGLSSSGWIHTELWKRLYHPAEARTASSPVVVTTISAECSPAAPLSPERLSFQEEKEEGENDSHSKERDEKVSPYEEEGTARFLQRTTALSKLLSQPEPAVISKP